MSFLRALLGKDLGEKLKKPRKETKNTLKKTNKMRFRYKNCREDDFYKNMISSIVSPKKTPKEKGILEIMIERATIKAKTIDALRAIGINSNLDTKKDTEKYSLSEYQN